MTEHGRAMVGIARPNNTLHPTSLPPQTFVSTFEGPLGGKAAGERGRWASRRAGFERGRFC